MEVIIQEAKRKSDKPSAVATETLYELLHDGAPHDTVADRAGPAFARSRRT